LAKNLNAIVLCGNNYLPFQAFVRGAYWLEDRIVRQSFSTHAFLAAAVDNPADLSSLSTQLNNLKAAQVTDASNPRDKVYAILSLFQNVFKGMDVNYAKSVEQVYIEATQAIVRSTQSLNVLYFRRAFNLSTSMPTWVVDWSNSSHFKLMNHLFSESTEQRSERIEFKTAGNTLSAYGFIFDTIESCGAPMKYSFASSTSIEIDISDVKSYPSSIQATSNISAIREWFSLVATKLEDPDRALHLLAQTLTCDNPENELSVAAMVTFGSSNLPHFEQSLPDINEIINRNLQMFQALANSAFGRSVSQLSLEQKLLLRLLSHQDYLVSLLNVSRDLDSRRIFITSLGYVGSAYEEIKEGDKIMLFEGAEFPMVVRQSETANHYISPADMVEIDVSELLKKNTSLKKFDIS
jgi:hypothetical protein